jgi:uncharacterized protein YwqG
MDLPSAINAIRSSPLHPRADALIDALRPSIRIRTTRDPSVATKAVSRFAGQPMLSKGMAWPTWDSSAYYQRELSLAEKSLTTGMGDPAFRHDQVEHYRREATITSRPLHFLAQIRLNELPAGARDVRLPDHGTLLFFYDATTSAAGFIPQSMGSSRVIWVRDDDLLVAAPPPDNAGADLTPSRLHFELEYTLPEALMNQRTEELFNAIGDKTAYDELAQRFRGEPPYHRIGGNPEEVQNGLFRTCQLATNGVEAGSPEALATPEAQKLALGTTDWRLLLQIDTDDDGPGWTWGDSGTLYFCIRDDDLRTERFDRIWCDEQSC